jgi:osmoprotectant transport system substrate-binding protein
MHPPLGRRGAALLGGACLMPAAAARAAPERAVVSSKIDTEGALLGNMILLALEAVGVPAANRLQLGPTRIVRAALLAGEVDIYPEYTGNAAFFFGMEDDPAWRSGASAHETAARLDAQANNLGLARPRPGEQHLGHRGARRRRAPGRAPDDGGLRRGRAARRAEARGLGRVRGKPGGAARLRARLRLRMPRRRVVVLPGGETAATLSAAAQNVSG